MKRQQSALDTYAAHTVLWRLLPPLLLDDPTFKKWKPLLEQGYRELLDNPAYSVAGNFTGIEYEADVSYNDEFLSMIGSRKGPQLEKDYRRTRAKAKAYVSAVRDLAKRLRLADSYGPPLIHSLVHSAVATPGYYRPPWTLSRPLHLSLEVAINPMTKYDPDDIPDLPNPVASYYAPGEPLPPVSWEKKGTDFQATATVRDLADLRKVLDALVGLLERDSGLRLRKPRGEAYRHLKRNTEWFYLNRCKKKSAMAIYEGLLRQGDPDPPDVSTIQKGIDQVKQLLSSVRVS